MGRIVVVDDIRLSADRRALHCCNTVEAIELFTKLVKSGDELDQLWLDYDMSSNRGIGWSTNVELAYWLIENQQSRTPLVVHNVFVHSRHHRANDLVAMLKSYFHVQLAELPDRLWWEQPEETEEEECE